MLKISRLVVFSTRLKYIIPHQKLLPIKYFSTNTQFDDDSMILIYYLIETPHFVPVTNLDTGQTTFELESESSGENTDEEIIGDPEDGEWYDIDSNDDNKSAIVKSDTRNKKDIVKEAHQYFEEFINTHMTQSQRDAIYDETLDPRFDLKDIERESLSPKEIKQIKKEKEKKRRIKEEELLKKIDEEKKMSISQYEEYMKLQVEGKVQSLEQIQDYINKLNNYIEIGDDGAIQGKESLKNITPKELAKKVGLPEELFLNPSDLKGIMSDKNFEKKFEELSIKRKLKEIRDIRIEKKERLKSMWNPKKFYQGKYRRPINRKLMKEVSNRLIDVNIPLPQIPKDDNIAIETSKREVNDNNEINEDNYEKYIEENILSDNEETRKNKKKRKKVLKRKLKKKEKEIELKKEEIEKHNKIQKLPKNIDEVLLQNNNTNQNGEEYDTTIVIRDLLDPNIDILPHYPEYQYPLSVSSYKLKLLRRIHYLIDNGDFYRSGIIFRNYPIHFTQVLSNTTGSEMCLFWDYHEKDYEEIKNDENYLLYQQYLDKTIKDYLKPDSIEIYLNSIHPLMISEDIKIQSCLELNKQSIKDEIIKHYHIMEKNFPILYFSKDYHNFSYNYMQFLSTQICSKLMNIKLGKDIDNVKRQKDYILKYKWFSGEEDTQKILDLLK